MTTQEIIDYYAKLLIIQYANKPKAYATIQALVGPLLMDQLPLAVQEAFNVDTAVGAQLDIIGKYVGADRQGYNFTGPMTLNDDDFRQIIKISICQNYSGSSLASIKSLLNQFFPGTLIVVDYKDMRFGYLFDVEIGSLDLAEFFLKEGKFPKPMGVQLSSLIYAPNVVNLFCFVAYGYETTLGSGLNTYANYSTNQPFLTYSDVILL